MGVIDFFDLKLKLFLLIKLLFYDFNNLVNIKHVCYVFEL